MEAFFPKALNLTLPNGNWHRTMRFEAGWNEVPDELAGHWWLKVNGVEIIHRTQQTAPYRPVFNYLDALAEEIDKLHFETEAEARSIVEDIADARELKAEVWEQVRRVLNNKLDAVRALAVQLDRLSAEQRNDVGP